MIVNPNNKFGCNHHLLSIFLLTRSKIPLEFQKFIQLTSAFFHLTNFFVFFAFFLQARNKPADGSGHVNQKGQSGQKAPAQGQQGKTGQKPQQKPTAQKGQVKAQSQPKAAATKAGGKQKKKGHKNQQYDLVVTINLVSMKYN